MFDYESAARRIYNDAENAMADIASCVMSTEDPSNMTPDKHYCAETEIKAEELWEDRDTLIDLIGGSVHDAAMENSEGWGTDDFKCIRDLILVTIGIQAIGRKHKAMEAAIDYMLVRG